MSLDTTTGAARKAPEDTPLDRDASRGLPVVDGAVTPKVDDPSFQTPQHTIDLNDTAPLDPGLTPEARRGILTRRNLLLGGALGLLVVGLKVSSGSGGESSPAPAASSPTSTGEIIPNPDVEPLSLNQAAQNRLNFLTPDKIATTDVARLRELVTISPDLYDGSLEGYGQVAGSMLTAVLNGVMGAKARRKFYDENKGIDQHSVIPGTDTPYYVDAMIQKLKPLLEGLFNVNTSGGGTIRPMVEQLKPLLLRSFLLGYDYTPEGQAYHPVFDGLTVTVKGNDVAISFAVKDSANMYETYASTVGTPFPKTDGLTPNRDPLNPNPLTLSATATLENTTGLGAKNSRPTSVAVTLR